MDGVRRAAVFQYPGQQDLQALEDDRIDFGSDHRRASCGSCFLISNTISVAAAFRRRENEIMRYIGATNFMIRAPFW